MIDRPTLYALAAEMWVPRTKARHTGDRVQAVAKAIVDMVIEEMERGEDEGLFVETKENGDGE